MSDWLGLGDRIAVVSGGGSGIGAGIKIQITLLQQVFYSKAYQIMFYHLYWNG